MASALTSPLGKWGVNDSLSLPTEHQDSSAPSRKKNHRSCCAHLSANEPPSSDSAILGTSEHTPSFLSVNLAQTPASLLAISWLSPPGQVIQGVCLPCILSKPCVLPSRISLAAI